MAKSRIISIKTLREKRFHTIDVFEKEWVELLGNPERNFKMAIVGPSTSGKSSFALRFADQLAKKWGKVLYNSHEEGLNQTIQQRAIERNVTAEKLYVADRMPFDQMMDKIKRNRYRSVFIDSIKFMGLSTAEYKELIATYGKHKSFVFIGHGDREGQMDGGRDIWKDADIKIWIAYGKAKITNRYSGETKVINLFTPRQMKSAQHQLL